MAREGLRRAGALTWFATVAAAIFAVGSAVAAFRVGSRLRRDVNGLV